MKIYISSSCNYKAEHIASYLRNRGCEVVSTWHSGSHISRNGTYDDEERQTIANSNDKLISKADILLLISDPHMVPGGKFVEAGIALGMAKTVIVLGKRENMLMWHELVQLAEELDDIDEILDALR